MNKVLLIGRIVKTPELRHTTEKNIPYLKFILAVDREFKNINKDKETDFIQIALWGRIAESLVEHLEKGRLINVIGRLKVGSYEIQEGERKYYAEIIAEQINFLDFKKEEKTN
ncbi:single-stranded DNA-binding protein B [Clostridium tepidiprofundi DSM 19306]|uniref:Single-stranded DNA-binding protein n=1 Tax=Clostridium tepidiprofundi DSM 19306 TaxID=1121338 RepID=A0A151B6B9_9CLOT|nr:single-stranded DNA-binding protein [Clostridium tepidiprofundi]KYH35434.1 single-stranded DNA-binding protein B [Clostridium tepidiprofundi DSM 19306]